MSVDTIALVLILVAGVLAGVSLAQSRGQALTAWAVLLVCIALLIPRVLR